MAGETLIDADGKTLITPAGSTRVSGGDTDEKLCDCTDCIPKTCGICSVGTQPNFGYDVTFTPDSVPICVPSTQPILTGAYNAIDWGETFSTVLVARDGGTGGTTFCSYSCYHGPFQFSVEGDDRDWLAYVGVGVAIYPEGRMEVQGRIYAVRMGGGPFSVVTFLVFDSFIDMALDGDLYDCSGGSFTNQITVTCSMGGTAVVSPRGSDAEDCVVPDPLDPGKTPCAKNCALFLCLALRIGTHTFNIAFARISPTLWQSYSLDGNCSNITARIFCWRDDDGNPQWRLEYVDTGTGLGLGTGTLVRDGADCFDATGWTALESADASVTAVVTSDTAINCAPCDTITQCHCCPRVGDTMVFIWHTTLGNGNTASGSGFVLANNASGTETLTWDGTSFKFSSGTPGVPLYISIEVTYNGEVDEDGQKRCAWGWSLTITDFDSDGITPSTAALSSGDGRGDCAEFNDNSVQAPGSDSISTILHIVGEISLTKCYDGGSCVDGSPDSDGTCL